MSQPRQNQGLEMLHILCVGHIMGLLVHRHLLLCLLKGPCALLVVVEAAAVPSDDYKELHDVLLVSLDAHMRRTLGACCQDWASTPAR